MKTKSVFKIAFVSILVFTVIGTYFWYLYFQNNQDKMFGSKKNLELINSGSIDYVNAVPNADPSNIPIYYFKVKNNTILEKKYVINLETVNPNEVNDGCDANKTFKLNELKYELTKDNQTFKSGLLSELENLILDSDKILANGITDYSIKIYLNDGTKSNLERHYHFRVTLVEK